MKPRPAPLSAASAEGHALPTLLALAYIREDGR
jgi:hypothetical protein